MGLTYQFEFKAPATTTARELEVFLRGIEEKAKAMGFRPTLVLNAVFDSTGRKQFARRLTTGLPVEDARLKGADVRMTAGCGIRHRSSTCCRKHQLNQAAERGYP